MTITEFVESNSVQRQRREHNHNRKLMGKVAVGAFALSIAANIGHVALELSEGEPTFVAGLVTILVATVGPIVVGASLEASNRQPATAPAGPAADVKLRWIREVAHAVGCNLPRLGFLVAMGLGFALSFDHIHALAELVGMSEGMAKVVPIAIDLLAFSATLSYSNSAKVLYQLDVERDEAIADHAMAEADRVEANRVAQVEAEQAHRRQVEAERAEADRLAAEADAKRLAVEAERLEAERAAAEAAQARMEALTAVKAANGTKGRKNGSSARGGSKGPSGDSLTLLIADHLEHHPHATRAQVAETLGVHPDTVKRNPAWRERRHANADIGELTAAASANGSTDPAAH